MADVRTSHTATPILRGFATWDKARLREVCLRGGLGRVAQGGSIANRPRREHLALASKGGHARGRQVALPRGVCPKRLLSPLRALLDGALTIESRTCLADRQISGETAGALEARGFATTSAERGAETVHITRLGRRALRWPS